MWLLGLPKVNILMAISMNPRLINEHIILVTDEEQFKFSKNFNCYILVPDTFSSTTLTISS